MAIGVGANATIFILLNALLIRPLPYEDPDRIVYLRGRNEKGQVRNVSYPDYLDWRRQAVSFNELGCYAFRKRPATIISGEPPEQCSVGFVSDNFFRILAAQPIVGRFFSEEDNQPLSPPVAVISHVFWRRHFATDPGLIGKSIILDGLNHTVVGVTSPNFRFPPYGGGSAADIWVTAGRAMSDSARTNRNLHGLARLEAGTGIQRAQAEMETICDNLAAEYPTSNAHMSVTMKRLHDEMTGGIRRIFFILMGTVLMVFVVACLNVAGLMFARSITRRREMALRSALGAARLRLMRLMLTENIILTLLGGCLGMLGATVAIKLLLGTGILPAMAFAEGFFNLDWHALGFALTLSIVAAPVCGLIPLICNTRANLASALSAGGRSIMGSRIRNTAYAGLVATQAALTILLLIAAGLMVRSLVNLVTADKGLNSRNVLVMDLRLTGERYASKESKAAFYQQLLDQLGSTTGIEQAGLTWPLFGGSLWYFHVEGQGIPSAGQEGTLATYKAVSPEYFEALEIRLLKGRFFSEKDYIGSPSVVIVDEILARHYWPDENWIGRRIKTGQASDPNSQWAQVVGVVGHVKNNIKSDSQMQIYQPLFQKSLPGALVILRTKSDPMAYIAAVKNAAYRLDRLQLVSDARTLDEEVWNRAIVHRLISSLLVVFAGIALFMSAVGIYAVTRYTVSCRTQEIGIRMALGAKPAEIVQLVFRGGLTPVFTGVAIGLIGTLAVARILPSILFDVSPWDPVTYTVVSLLLVGVAFLACYLPARGVLKIDPMTALRYE